MTSQDIRSQFLSFFESKGHQLVTSAPLVLKDDPTLMFVNSGMAPFKSYFLGTKLPKNPRVANTQKCLRVSGKHNDLEDVGYDTYHHTLFEMMGNWSFGDYFKKDAIDWAWELLTIKFKIDPAQIYVTVFEGDQADQLPKDEESFQLWKQLIAEDRILNGNKKDNFWEMGSQGPCGPCSEIHVDVRSAEERALVDGKTLVNQDHPQVVEVWNLVFMQYNRLANGSLENLPQQHIDTGMGFERLCMVLQGKTSNYDTDVFQPLIKKIESLTNHRYGQSEKNDIAIRVIADHCRAVAFAITDGQLPSNNGAGYVIRRILRRAVRYGFTFLDIKVPFIFKLAQVLADQMGEAFPEIRSQIQLVSNVIKEEESSFLKTLDQGLIRLDQMIEDMTSNTLDGQKAFELYDTFGFPVDLTSLILNEKGLKLDEAGFDKALMAQKDRSRSADASSTADWTVLLEDDLQEFVGYDHTEAIVKITKYRKVTHAKGGDAFQLVFNLTPFYPEGGGQIGDSGYIESADGSKIEVIDTKKENDQVYHLTKTLPKQLDSNFKAVVNGHGRVQTTCNHTATHLLHQALREVLGTHVEQKGSAVQPKHLRFDFSHYAKLSEEEILAVEQFVNDRIRDNIKLEEQRQVPMEVAMATGAMALFGEKYGDTVSTVKFGSSIELCGGTHVQQTSDLWYFKITTETAVAAGIRRIEAITGDEVKARFYHNDKLIAEISSALKSPNSTLKSIEALQAENLALRKEVEQLKREKARQLAVSLSDNFVSTGGVQFLAEQVEMDAQGLKDLSFALGAEKNNAFIVLASEFAGKAFLSCYISKELVDSNGFDASQVIRELGIHIDGGGGGQNFFATAGGKNPKGIGAALSASRLLIS